MYTDDDDAAQAAVALSISKRMNDLIALASYAGFDFLVYLLMMVREEALQEAERKSKPMGKAA